MKTSLKAILFFLFLNGFSVFGWANSAQRSSQKCGQFNLLLLIFEQARANVVHMNDWARLEAPVDGICGYLGAARSQIEVIDIYLNRFAAGPIPAALEPSRRELLRESAYARASMETLFLFCNGDGPNRSLRGNRQFLLTKIVDSDIQMIPPLPATLIPTLPQLIEIHGPLLSTLQIELERSETYALLCPTPTSF